MITAERMADVVNEVETSLPPTDYRAEAFFMFAFAFSDLTTVAETFRCTESPKLMYTTSFVHQFIT